MAGAVAAEGLGIPHVEHSFGVLRPTEIRRRATETVAPFAARRGVPMLAIPQGADQFLNAGRVVDSGVGLRLLPDELSAATAVQALLDDDRYRDAARVHQASIEAMPAPEAVVRILEAAV